MKKVFTVTEVTGSKRSTKAEYTHALIGNYDWDKRIELDAKIQDWEKCNFDWAVKNASMSFDEFCKDNKYNAVEKNNENYNRYKETVLKYPTLAEYLQGRANERVAFSTAMKAKNGSPVVVLAWASRYDLACNRVSEFAGQNYTNLKVVPTVRIK